AGRRPRPTISTRPPAARAASHPAAAELAPPVSGRVVTAAPVLAAATSLARDTPKGTDAGGSPSGLPPGPPWKLSHVVDVVWYMPRLAKSHTPVGKACCSSVHCESLKVTPGK